VRLDDSEWIVVLVNERSDSLPEVFSGSFPSGTSVPETPGYAADVLTAVPASSWAL
jgi:hypothetical protein